MIIDDWKLGKLVVRDTKVTPVQIDDRVVWKVEMTYELVQAASKANESPDVKHIETTGWE